MFAPIQERAHEVQQRNKTAISVPKQEIDSVSCDPRK